MAVEAVIQLLVLAQMFLEAMPAAYTNYLLCHGQNRYLSYVPSPVNKLIPIGSLRSTCENHHIYIYYYYYYLCLDNVEVISDRDGVYISENSGPRSLTVNSGPRSLTIDNSTLELAMVNDEILNYFVINFYSVDFRSSITVPTRTK